MPFTETYLLLSTLLITEKKSFSVYREAVNYYLENITFEELFREIENDLLTKINKEIRYLGYKNALDEPTYEIEAIHTKPKDKGLRTINFLLRKVENNPFPLYINPLIYSYVDKIEKEMLLDNKAALQINFLVAFESVIKDENTKQKINFLLSYYHGLYIDIPQIF